MSEISSVHKICKYCLRKTLFLVNRLLLHPIECLIAPKADKELSYPPIFIIGAPRSGSTLLAQVLIEAFDFGYISNLHCLFYGAPSIVERLFHLNNRKSHPNFKSKYGVTKGWLSPSECGEYWYRFFERKPAYTSLNAAKLKKMKKMRCSINGLMNAFNKPILFKNMYTALRLHPIINFLPESLFIVTERNIIENAHSLLEGRKRIYKDYSCWWSMEPPEIESLKKLPPEQQVVEQIRHIQALIQSDIIKSGINPNRFLYINYEYFSADVHTNLKRVKNFLKQHNIELQINYALIPKVFPVRKHVRISPELFQKVKYYVEHT